MVFLWFSYGFPMVSNGFPMVFLWFPYGFPMVHQAAKHGVSLFPKIESGRVRYPFPYVSDTLFAPSGAPAATCPEVKFSVARGCLSLAIGSKQTCCKTIVFYSILLLQLPLLRYSESKKP